MPDQAIPLDTAAGERRSPSTGLPIFCTEPLTAAEREQLRAAARTLRLIAERLDEAHTANRVTYALQAVAFGVDAGLSLAQIAVRLGSRR